MIILALAMMLQELPEAQLITEEGGRDIFPPAFHGTWANTLADCGDIEFMTITRDRLSGRESGAILLKNGGMIRHTARNGQPAYTINALVAQSGEGDVGIGRLRISRVGDMLYTSNAEVVGETSIRNYPAMSGAPIGRPRLRLATLALELKKVAKARSSRDSRVASQAAARSDLEGGEDRSRGGGLRPGSSRQRLDRE